MTLKFDKNSLVRRLATGYKLVPHLDKAVMKETPWRFEFKPKEHDDAFHPSGDCLPSVCDLYWSAKEREERKFNASLLKTFMVGHFWHQWLQYLLVRDGLANPEAVERRGSRTWGKKLELWYQDEGRAPVAYSDPYHWATGQADVAPVTIPIDGSFLVDFKTMNATDFKQNEPPARFVDSWECQMNIYMDFFDLERTLVVGICKDSPHTFKEFEFRRNQELVDAIYKKWRLVSECITADVEPPEDYEVDLPLKGTV